MYPEYFTAEDIEQFEYEYNRFIDLQDPYSLESINVELQVAADTISQTIEIEVL